MERYVNLNSREITCGAFMLSRVQIFMTPWTIVHQVSLSMEFSSQEGWSGVGSLFLLKMIFLFRDEETEAQKCFLRGHIASKSERRYSDFWFCAFGLPCISRG